MHARGAHRRGCTRARTAAGGSKVLGVHGCVLLHDAGGHPLLTVVKVIENVVGKSTKAEVEGNLSELALVESPGTIDVVLIFYESATRADTRRMVSESELERGTETERRRQAFGKLHRLLEARYLLEDGTDAVLPRALGA